jgi:hypothetical protein
MVIRVAIEIVLVVLLFLIGVGFWNCAKSPRFLLRLLSDYDVLRRFYLNMKREQFERTVVPFPPAAESATPEVAFPVTIASYIRASLIALSRTRNMLSVPIVGILVGSHFLGSPFLLINLAVFLLLALPPLSDAAQNNAFSDIATLALYVYKWNQIDEEECRWFCNERWPRFLKTLHRVLTEGATDSIS